MSEYHTGVKNLRGCFQNFNYGAERVKNRQRQARRDVPEIFPLNLLTTTLVGFVLMTTLCFVFAQRTLDDSTVSVFDVFVAPRAASPSCSKS